MEGGVDWTVSVDSTANRAWTSGPKVSLPIALLNTARRLMEFIIPYKFVVVTRVGTLVRLATGEASPRCQTSASAMPTAPARSTASMRSS